MVNKIICILLSVLLIVLVNNGCKIKKHENEIVFSCIYCKGCVLRQLDFIKNESLDKKYKIILDTTCIKPLVRELNFKYTQKDNEQIFQTYGEFGNLLYFDSKGKKIELMTDMNLSEIVD